MGVHTYIDYGISQYDLDGEMGAGTTTAVTTTPAQYLVVPLTNDALLADLHISMRSRGFVYVGAGNLVPSMVGIRQIGRAQLSVDASTISSTAWTDVLTVSLSTSVGSLLKIEGSCGAGVLIGGAMRLLIDGGAYANMVLATNTYPLLSGNAPGQASTYIEGLSADTYTIKIQVSASALGAVTPRAGSSLIVTEHAV